MTVLAPMASLTTGKLTCIKEVAAHDFHPFLLACKAQITVSCEL